MGFKQCVTGTKGINGYYNFLTQVYFGIVQSICELWGIKSL